MQGEIRGAIPEHSVDLTREAINTMTPDDLEKHVREQLDLCRTPLTPAQEEEINGYYEKTLAGEKLTARERARSRLLTKDIRGKLRTEETE